MLTEFEYIESMGFVSERKEDNHGYYQLFDSTDELLNMKIIYDFEKCSYTISTIDNGLNIYELLDRMSVIPKLKNCKRDYTIKKILNNDSK